MRKELQVAVAEFNRLYFDAVLNYAALNPLSDAKVAEKYFEAALVGRQIVYQLAKLGIVEDENSQL